MFGGDVISLILPKLILSVALDGILTFSRPFRASLGQPERFFALLNDNKQAGRVQPAFVPQSGTTARQAAYLFQQIFNI
jgi:hypothetical protein